MPFHEGKTIDINKKIKKENSLQKHSHLFSPINKVYLPEKVSPGILKKASLTVECAFILPLFLLAMATLICFMDILKLQTEQLSKVCDQAKSAGIYAHVSGNFSEDIRIPGMSYYEFSVSVIPLPRKVLINYGVVHPWVGYRGKGREKEYGDSEMVLVTTHGNVYHTKKDCTYLDLSIIQVRGDSVKNRRNQYGEKYHACESCAYQQSPKDRVYITETGNRYHNQSSCSGLKRTVRLVEKSSFNHMQECHRCAGK